MKIYALIIILLMCFGCRSSRNTTDTHVSDHSKETNTEVTSETISLQSSMLATTRATTDTNIKEYFRTTTYNADGSISEVQEQWRDTRRNELADSTGQRSDVSGIVRYDSTTTEIDSDIEVEQITQSNTDSRPVQGVEWLYIASISGVIILVVYLIRKNKK